MASLEPYTGASFSLLSLDLEFFDIKKVETEITEKRKEMSLIYWIKTTAPSMVRPWTVL